MQCSGKRAPRGPARLVGASSMIAGVCVSTDFPGRSPRARALSTLGLLPLILLAACKGGAASEDTGNDAGETGSEPPTAPACDVGSAGSEVVAAPELSITLANRWREAWLGSAAVADLDGDGAKEIIVPRGNQILVWRLDGSIAWSYEAEGGRIWASPVVADLDADGALEIAFAAREQLYMLEADGSLAAGFPVSWEDELRSLAAGDLDGDAELELVVAPAHGGPTDVMQAFNPDGSVVAGFPPNQAGASGCDEACYLAGCFDQNLAVGDLDGDGRADVVAPHDNAYASIHRSSGEAFDAAPEFTNATKTPGVRYLHAIEEAQMGWAPDEQTANQAHFTNTAPAIADLDGDGQSEVIMLGSVQNAAQNDRERGVALWVVGADAKRRPGFETPAHAPDFLAGLWDFEGTNLVGATNQVSVADIDADEPGLEVVFAGFDGKIHAVSADGRFLWSTSYTTSTNVLTAGVAIADLSADGIPEIVFNSYGTEDESGALFILDAGGNLLHQVPLPRRGAMPVPTLADVDDDGVLDIVVSLKDAEDGVESVRIYRVPSAQTNCVLWPTGRGNDLRNGWVPPQ